MWRKVRTLTFNLQCGHCHRLMGSCHDVAGYAEAVRPSGFDSKSISAYYIYARRHRRPHSDRIKFE